ncbi:hypothetical protein [Segnochrobactrum spirostomi]|uniref:Uncharacterized protein n=1 Tax=Segnochrobactrum spirostomi TaxID=2608987 RepID=A0A6A7Y7W5_9HYPH|nr:hypothetical protein [Segnochrobactrum spirostomi]MQT14946.1 hypothetical protein [Segnochrobactrum spirostomi]
MTRSELLAALPEGRLPPDLMHLHAADLLALAGLGLVVAAFFAALMLPLLQRRPSRRARIRATRGLPPQERLLAVARILGHLPETFRTAAYRDEPIDEAALERAAVKARRVRP